MGYIIPVLLAVTIALLLLLSLSSVAIWRHYQVSNYVMVTSFDLLLCQAQILSQFR